MTDRHPHRLTWILAFLALAVPTSFAPADEPPAEKPQDAAAESAAEESAAEAEVYKNFLRWSTASEDNNFGYDVYRGESENGGFERITEKPILGAGTTDEPMYYEFVDDAVDPYKTYYYFIESISMTGHRMVFSPTVRKAPKIERESAESEDGEEEKADESDGWRR